MGKAQAYHGVNTSLVAGLDQKSDVCVHEGYRHGDRGAVGKDKVGVVTELLNEGEDVIPSSTVQARAVVSQFINDLVHLKGSSDGFNEDGTSDSASRHTYVVLSSVEDVVPQTSFQVRLHLGEIEVWASASLDELMGIVEEVETKVKQTAGDWLSINSEMLLIKVPASSTGNECGELPIGAEFVLLTTEGEVNLTADGIVKVHLTIDHVLPCWSR